MAVFIVMMPLGQAAPQFWDPDGVSGGSTGGSGTWDTINPFWDNGGSMGAWNNAALNTAVFGGTGGAVSVGTGITVGGLRFDTTAYTISTGAHTLTFGAADNTITLNLIAAATVTGAVAGAGNVTLSGGISGGQTPGTLTLNGTSAGGWTGATTIENGITLSLAANSQALRDTSAITLNGGGILLASSNAVEASLDRVNNGAGVTSKGGAITIANTPNSTVAYAETFGALELNSGRLVLSSTNQNTGGTQRLIFSSLARTGAGNTSAISFVAAGGLNLSSNQMIISGAAATPAGQVIGPWATTGTTAASQTDYAVHHASGAGNVIPASIAATAQSNWSNATHAYTMSGSTALTGTRTITALRLRDAGAQLDLGSGANLETYGVLNGSSGTFTIAPGTGGVLTTPSGGGSLYLTAGTNLLAVNAPLNDNGGAVTVVVSGANTLALTAASSTYSGGTVINSGTLSINGDAALGATSGGITFNGSATLTVTAGGATLHSDRTIALNNGALATVTTGNIAGPTIAGKITGSGGLVFSGTSGAAARTLTLSSTANDFEGVLRIGSTVTNGSVAVNAASLADSPTANGAIRLGGSGASSTAAFGWHADAAAPLVLNNRQIDLAGGEGVNGLINNHSTSHTVTINTDLLVSGSGNKTLTLGGAGNGTFAGRIADGAAAAIGLVIAGSGSWALTGNNTFTGNVIVDSGTLRISHGSALGAGGDVIADGTVVNAGAVLEIVNGAVVSEHLTLNLSGTLRGSGTASWGGTIVVSNSPFDVPNAGDTLSLAGQITGTGGITKLGAGTLELAGAPIPANDFQGPVIVDGGTLALNRTPDPSPSPGGATIPNSSASGGGVVVNAGKLLWMNDHQVGNGVPITLAGGMLDLDGFSDVVGALTLTADSIIDFGAGASTLTFADSSANPWTETLSVWNWTGNANTGGGTDQLFFGIGGLTGAQAQQIAFFTGSNGAGFIGYGTLLGTGEVVASTIAPVPEPSAALSALLLLSIIGWRERSLVLRLRHSRAC